MPRSSTFDALPSCKRVFLAYRPPPLRSATVFRASGLEGGLLNVSTVYNTHIVPSLLAGSLPWIRCCEAHAVQTGMQA